MCAFGDPCVLISRFPLGVDIPVLPEFLGNELYADMLHVDAWLYARACDVRIGNVSVVEQYRLSNEDVAASPAPIRHSYLLCLIRHTSRDSHGPRGTTYMQVNNRTTSVSKSRRL